MPKKKKSNNLNIAFLFIVLVLGLIIISVFFKFIFVIKDSRFDGSNKFVIAFIAQKETGVVSFSPQNKTVSILKFNQKIKEDEISKFIEVPIDGIVEVKSEKIEGKNISSALWHLELSLGSSYKKITFIDILRLYLFVRSVPAGQITERELSNDLSNNQKSTIISLTFSDPKIYQENQSIEIINATSTFGLGNKLANLITNIGGNVVLVQSAEKNQKNSELIYFKDKTYTVKYLSNFLGYKISKSDNRGVADVIIILGEDSLENQKF